MIIIDNLSIRSLILLKPISKVGIYFFYYQTNLKEPIKNKFFKPITFDKKSNKNLKIAKCINFGEEKFIRGTACKFFPKDIVNKFSKNFKFVKDLENKLITSFICSLSLYYAEQGYIHSFSKLNCKKNELTYIIHTNIIKYSCRLNPLGVNKDIVHIYIPFDDLYKLATKTIFLICNYIKSLPKIIRFLSWKSGNISNPNNSKHIERKTALIIHGSLSYGKLYYKNHYFSNKPNSPLNNSNITLYVINKKSPISQKYNNNLIIDLKNKAKIKHFFFTFILILKCLTSLRNSKQFFGLMFLSLFYLKFIAWRDYFSRTDIKNVIYDFDVLFPKPLALALESNKINTLAIQERPNTSFSSIQGVIVDNYLFAGEIYKNYAEKNKSFIIKNGYSFGMWRLSLFEKSMILPIGEISFRNSKNKKISDYSNFITFLGHFYDDKNNKAGFNIIALNELLNNIKKISADFKNFGVILRLKSIRKSDIKLIMDKFDKVENFFLCDDYSADSISYRICKESSLIFSVLTSLGEECLAFGKKVIFLDNFYPISNFCRDAFPKDFHFAIPKNERSLLKLCRKCLNNDIETSIKYKNLKIKINGKIDFNKKNIIPDTIEKFLI